MKEINVCITKNGQYILTLPKTIAQMLNVKKGDKINFNFNNMGQIVLSKK